MKSRFVWDATKHLQGKHDQSTHGHGNSNILAKLADLGEVYAKFVLKYGKEYIPDSQTYSGKRDAPKQCFANAGRRALLGEGTYVEGYVFVHGIPLQHAWLEKNGKLVDTTIKNDRGITGYFGVPFKLAYVAETAARTKVWGLISYTNRALLTAKKSTFLEESSSTKSATKHLQGKHNQSTHGHGGSRRELGKTRAGGLENDVADEFLRQGLPVDVALGDYSSPTANGTNRQFAKSEIVKSVSERLLESSNLDEVFIRNYLERDASLRGERLERAIQTIDERERQIAREVGVGIAVQQTLDTWADTSSDESSRSISLQIAAMKEFGLSESSMDGIRRHGKEYELWGRSEERYVKEGDVQRAVLRAMYDETQERFAKLGITELTLYRGMSASEESLPKMFRNKVTRIDQPLEVQTTVELNPLSSFSSSKSISSDFFTGLGEAEYSILLTGTVPVSRIVATSRTGIGSLGEQEFVILAGEGEFNVSVRVRESRFRF